VTQVNIARSGRVSPEVVKVAKDESLTTDFIRKGLSDGTIVLPKNKNHNLPKPCAIGKGLKTKINANIGTSKDSSSISDEIKKMEAAIEAGADAIMDLSTGGALNATRKKIIEKSAVAIGTVPIYEMVVMGLKRFNFVKDIPVDYMMSILESQAKEGVDFFTIHAGVTSQVVKTLKSDPRILDIVSRGGAFMAEWMIENDQENPFYEHFDEVIDIAKRYDVTLSLGDGLRPGAIADATDSPQIMELLTLGELQKRALAKGVQVMIEGPGHVPINQIEANVLLEKSVCNGAPFYVLGPLVTDVAPGYDHITAAIGGAIAASKGADFLCYVTPSEHLRLPSLEDVREGVIASKIAAHVADIAKGVKGAMEWDIAMSKARKERNWEKQFAMSIDKIKPKKYRATSKPGVKDVCTMCGEYCSIKTAEKCFKR